jgi:hypothetical protein
MRTRLLPLLVLLAALLAWPAAAAADHPFLPGHFPFPKEKEGFPIPSPLLPEHALTGYETPRGNFKDTCGLAVDQNGAVYVSDYYHDVIDRFEWLFEEGVTRFGFGGLLADADPEGGPCGLALGANAIYVNDYRRGVWRHGFGESPLEIDAGPATGVAVDPGSGRVYVTHKAYVAVYEADGTPVLEGGEPMRIGVGALDDSYGAAVSGFGPTQGYLYVADAADETVKVFDPATSVTVPIETIDGALGPQQGFRDLIDAALAVDPANGNILVSDRLARAEDPPMVVDEISPNGNFRGQLQHAIGDGEPAGIALDPTNHDVYVTTGRRGNAGVYAFGPAGLTDALLVTKAGSGEGTVTSAPANISCPSACVAGEAEFDIGSLVVLSADPTAHSAFSGWKVSGQPGACLGTGTCQVQMTGDVEVTAEFAAIPQQTLSVATDGNGAGTVTSSPAGIECGAVCSDHFNQGSTVVLTANPAPHSHLAGWAVAGQPSACPGSGTCEVAMGQATLVTANFAVNPDRSLSLSLTGPGRVVSSPGGIDCRASCGHAFADGTAVSLEAEPADGYELLGWSAACSGRRRCLVQMDEDHAVGATFVRIEDALAVSVIGSGTGTVSDPAANIDCGLTCAGIYLRGSVLTLTAKAEKGSRFIGFSGCDSVAGATCTVSVTEAKTITAIFGEAPEIAVRRISVRGARANLSVSVPAPGLVQATGRGVVKAKVRARNEGVVNLHLKLSTKGRRMLRSSREGKLSIKVALLFTSADGSTVRTKKIVTFRRGRG